MPGRGDRSRCVQQDRVALRAAQLAGEDRADRPRRSPPALPPASAAGSARLDPELARVDHPLAHLAVDDLETEVRPARRELVDATEAVHDERAARAELGERIGDRRGRASGE